MADSYVLPSDVIGIALMGGKGERLGLPTWVRAKPAVMFGNSILGAVSTSNAYNSQVKKIIVASQYRPYSLKKFYSDAYGDSGDFGPERKLSVISPQDSIDDPFYSGTADAMFHAMSFASREKSGYVLSLSGDHVYKEDFSKLFNIYKSDYPEDAFIILSQKVLREKASDFGILMTKGNSTEVVDFKEKPKTLPKGKKEFDASMGIYFAPRHLWKKILKPFDKRSVKEKIEYDMGKNVIPELVKSGVPVHVYTTDTYWADVGRIDRLYDAYRQIFIQREPDLMGDKSWPIEMLGSANFVNNKDEHYFYSGKEGDFKNNKSKLNGTICSPGVSIDRAEALDSILLGKSQGILTEIGLNAVLSRAIVDKMVTMENNSRITSKNGLAVVAKHTKIAKGTIYDAEGDLWVAHIEDMARDAVFYKVKSYLKKIDEGSLPPVEIFDPNNGIVTLDDITQQRNTA